MSENELGLPAHTAAPALGAGSTQPAASAAPPPLAPAPARYPTAGVFGTQPGASAFGEESRGSQRLRNARKRIGSAFAAVAALVAKFFAAIKGAILLLPKVKVLTTAGTALISVVLYSLVFGWWFAVGFVALLFVHEMGHVIQLRREGIRASAPVFIPFLGAVVGMKQMPDDALAEARVGLAGPILGSLGAAVCLAIALASGSTMLRALAYVGFLLNLINLVPLTPFDGGRAMAAMAPAMWFVGLGVTVALLLATHITFLWIFVLLGGYDTYRRWKLRKGGSLQQAAYYRVSPRARMLVGAVYVGLIAALAAGMIASEVIHYAGHTFNVR
jgi:Zn-dependent protease